MEHDSYLRQRVMLIDAIRLLYYQSCLKDKSSTDLNIVINLLNRIPTPTHSHGRHSEADILIGLKQYAESMCQTLDIEYDRNTIIGTLHGICQSDKGFCEWISTLFTDHDNDASSLNKAIRTINNNLLAAYRHNEIEKKLNEALNTWNKRTYNAKNTDDFIRDTIASLEPLQHNTKSRDPGIIGNTDLGDDSQTNEITSNAIEIATPKKLLITGWQGLNRMMNGGFKRGSFIQTNALAHNYKSGFNLTLMKDFAIFNQPEMIDPTKKPLLLRFSFEDDTDIDFKFLYQVLKMEESHDEALRDDVPIGEMKTYIKKRMQVNGYHAHIVRVDPSYWTYKNLCSYIINLEAEGYEIHVCFIDYLYLLPRAGCSTSPVAGADVKDLFVRIRNFFAVRKTTIITPHQLSSEAQGLIRGGVPPERFVREVAGKGYTEGCRTLQTVIDVDLYLHLVTDKEDTYLSMYKAKHKGSITNPMDRYALMKFPTKLPIPPDLNGPDQSFKSLQEARLNGRTPSSNVDDSLFTF